MTLIKKICKAVVYSDLLLPFASWSGIFTWDRTPGLGYAEWFSYMDGHTDYLS
jgi:hypothetical protein